MTKNPSWKLPEVLIFIKPKVIGIHISKWEPGVKILLVLIIPQMI